MDPRLFHAAWIPHVSCALSHGTQFRPILRTPYTGPNPELWGNLVCRCVLDEVVAGTFVSDTMDTLRALRPTS